MNNDGSFYSPGNSNDLAADQPHPTLGFIDGDFYGQNTEESAGVFERDFVLGAWQVADFSQIVPYLTDGKDAFKVCRPAAGPCTFSFAQFYEFRDRLLNPLDGIVDAAQESASIKWTLMSRTYH